ncbi:MAG: ferritin-like domain-containing protein [Myxococcota bacterium]
MTAFIECDSHLITSPDQNLCWRTWRRYFEGNRHPAPLEIDAAGIPVDTILRRCLAKTFSIFQLGEAGEGRIAKEAWRFKSSTVDDHWRVALTHWVREEGRHGRLLGDCARALGGKPLSKNWTNTLLIFGRRLLGIRLKLLVVLSAEVIGITFYGLLARALPGSSIQRALQTIALDEEKHLEFHALFFRRQTSRRWQRILFWAAWMTVGTAAGAAVLIDHAQTFRYLGIDRFNAARRFMALLVETARTVTSAPTPRTAR